MATVALLFAVLRIGGSASDVGYVAAAYLVPLIGCPLLGPEVANMQRQAVSPGRPEEVR